MSGDAENYLISLQTTKQSQRQHFFISNQINNILEQIILLFLPLIQMVDDPFLASKNTRATLIIITNHLRSWLTYVEDPILRIRILESMCCSLTSAQYYGIVCSAELQHRMIYLKAGDEERLEVARQRYLSNTMIFNSVIFEGVQAPSQQ